MATQRFYLGLRAVEPQVREIFKAETDPTFATHGDRYNAVVGPFVTKRGAVFMRDYGRSNPHCRTVAEAERIARTYR